VASPALRANRSFKRGSNRYRHLTRDEVVGHRLPNNPFERSRDRIFGGPGSALMVGIKQQRRSTYSCATHSPVAQRHH
jgi:hypothetical protein